MVRFKKFLTLLCSIIFAASLSFNVSAEQVDINSWNKDSVLYDVLDNTAESNSAVEYAFLRVKYDRPSNRIRLLFMLELNSFTDESNAGITLSINGDEEITLHLNGTAEYNVDKYFAELNSISDQRTKTLYLEVILGIKHGIPNEVKLEFNVYDTEGVASNTYCVDITEYPEELTSEDSPSDEEEQKTEKTNRTKSTKAKTTKTHKSKTSVTKTTKNNKTLKDKNDVQSVITDDIGDESQTLIEPDNPESVAEDKIVISKNKIVAIAVAAALVTGCAVVSITFILKKTRMRDGG